MLRSVKALEKCAIRATDGNVGQVGDLLFDDLAWVIRYLVVDTGTWHAGRKVLISTLGMRRPNWTDNSIAVPISKNQVRESSDIDARKPLTRQRVPSRLEQHYPERAGSLQAWGGNYAPCSDVMLSAIADPSTEPDSFQSVRPGSPALRNDSKMAADGAHLRSCNVVMNSLVTAADGDIGRVCGLLIDEDIWAIRYFVVNTGNWWLGHKVVLAPEWIDDISWSDSRLSVDTTRQAVQDAPGYDSVAEVNRRLEIVIYRHYGRMGYWMSDIDPGVSP